MNDDNHAAENRAPEDRADDDRGSDDIAEHDPAFNKRVFKVLQGYVWHPEDAEVDLGAHLPARIGDDIRVLWDPLPRAPFTFFDDGTLAETQTVYQLTVLAFVDSDQEPGPLVPWLAEKLQADLETTPSGVGWQIMEDLREMAR